MQDDAKTEQQLSDDLRKLRQREEDLAAREARYQSLFSTMLQGVVYQAADGGIIDANPAAEKLLGLTLAQMQGRTSMDSCWRAIREDGSGFPGEEHPSMVALRTGCEVRDVVMGIHHPERGEYRWLNIQAIPQFLPGQTTPFQVYTTFLDITARKKTEEALRANLKRLHFAHKAANSGCWEWDLQTNENYWSEELWALYGLEPHSCKPSYDNWLQTIFPEDRETAGRTVLAAATNRKELIAEWRVQGRDGATRWLLSHGKPLCDQRGQTVRYIGIVQDITERKRVENELLEHRACLEKRVEERTAELAASNTLLMQEIGERQRIENKLRQSEERVSLALEGAELGLWDWNIDTGEVVFNERWANMLGYSLEELEPHVSSWEKLVHPEDMPSVREILTAHLEGRTPFYESEHRLLTKSGDWVWILDKGKVIDRDQQGHPRRVTGTHLDISTRKRAEEEHRHVEKAESLSRMAGAIAHNFNNMLGAIMGNLELLADEIPEGSEQQRHVKEALRASERAATTSRLMLAYVGQSMGAVEPINVSKIVREACSLFITAIPANVHLKTELASLGSTIKGNSAQFLQIVNNLVTNAVEAIGEKEGEITLKATVVPKPEIMETRTLPLGWRPTAMEYIKLSITDTGCGIAPDNQDKIFDPFFTTKFPGRGLGLSVVSGLLQGFAGAISFESQPGKGATFKLFFPVFEHDVHDSPGTEVLALDATAEKRELLVLVIDDEPVVRNMAEAMLTRKIGCQVITARDGFEAVEIFKGRQNEIDLVLLDLSMPGISGWETLTAIRKVRPDIPVILTSGYDKSQAITNTHRERPQMFLQKPYHRDDLKAAIKAVLHSDMGAANDSD